MLLCGLRSQEVLNLRVSDIDLEDRVPLRRIAPPCVPGLGLTALCDTGAEMRSPLYRVALQPLAHRA